MTELLTKYDYRQSFYGKARIDASYPEIKLISYATHVASIKYNGQPDDQGTAEVYGTYSATTLRHIKEFLKQHGFKTGSKAQIMTDYGVEQP